MLAIKYKRNKLYFLICFCPCRWGSIEFPMPFGRVMSPTESFIHGLDEKVMNLSVVFSPYLWCLPLTILFISRLVCVYSFILEIHGKCLNSKTLFGVELMNNDIWGFSVFLLQVVCMLSVLSLPDLQLWKYDGLNFSFLMNKGNAWEVGMESGSLEIRRVLKFMSNRRQNKNRIVKRKQMENRV